LENYLEEMRGGRAGRKWAERVNGDGIGGWGPERSLYGAGGTVVAIAGRRKKKVDQRREIAREFLEVAVGSTRSSGRQSIVRSVGRIRVSRVWDSSRNV
jgi:hypothetical protein